jgi:hypothetical protein
MQAGLRDHRTVRVVQIGRGKTQHSHPNEEFHVSVLDDLRAAEERVAQRLKELEPAVTEYRELAEVAKRLGIDVEEATPVAKGSRPALRRTRAGAERAKSSATTAKASTRPRSRAATGKRSEQLVDLVRARPGITVREAGTELGVDPTSLYRIIHRLEESGAVRKNGRGLEIAGAAG